MKFSERIMVLLYLTMIGICVLCGMGSEGLWLGSLFLFAWLTCRVIDLLCSLHKIFNSLLAKDKLGKDKHGVD